MSDLQPGDLVVCVDRTARGSKYDESLTRLCLGRSYRVVAVRVSPRQNSLLLRGVRSTSPSGRFCASHFRRLNDEPDDVALIERIRRCQPIPAKENANV